MNKMFATTESLSQSLTTSSTPSTKVTHTVDAPDGQEFIIFFSAEINTVTNVGTQAKVDLIVDGVTVASFAPRAKNTTETLNIFFFHKVTGKTEDFDCRIDYSSTNNINQIAIQNARIVAWRYDTLQGLDLQYAEANPTSTGLTASMADGASVTFEPPTTGNYFVFGVEGFAPGSTTVSVIAQIDVNGTIYPIASDTTGRWNREAPAAVAGALYSFFGFARQSLDTGANRTVKVQAQNESGTTGSRQYSRILAFREDAFANLYYDEEDIASEHITTSTTYVARSSVTASAPSQESDFLVIAGAIHGADVVTPEAELYQAHVLVDGNEALMHQFTYQESASPADRLSMGFAGIHTDNSGFTATIEHRMQNRTDDDAAMKNNFVLIIQEEAVSTQQTVTAKGKILSPSEDSDIWQYTAGEVSTQTITAKGRIQKTQRYGIDTAHFDPKFSYFPEDYEPFDWGISQNGSPSIRSLTESPLAVRISVPIGQYYAYYRSISGNNTVGTTVEADLKWVSGDEGDLQLVIQDGTRNAWVHIYNGFVKMNGGSAVAVNTTQYHRYRLTLKGTTSRLYVDNTLVATNTLATTTSSQFVIIGDFGIGSSVCQYYIRKMWYSTRGAFAPIKNDSVLPYGVQGLYARGRIVKPISQLRDNFNNDSLDTTLWGVSNFTETNQHLEAVDEEEAELYSSPIISGQGFNSKSYLWSFENEAVYGEFIMDSQNASYTLEWSIQFVLGLDRIYFQINNGTIKGFDKNDSEIFSTSYNATTHRWLRLRETAGTFYFEYSADSYNWNTFDTLSSSGYGLRAARFYIYVNDSTLSRTTIIDNINFGFTQAIQTIDAKARIGGASVQSITAKGRIEQSRTQTIQAKGRIGGFTEQTVTAKGRIEVQNTQEIQAKSSILRTFSQEIEAKGDILRNFSQNINAKANIKATFEQNVQSKGRIETPNTQEIQAKGAIKHTFSAEIEAKARIFITNDATITAKGNIKATVVQTISARARMGGGGFQSIQAKGSIKKQKSRSITAKGNIRGGKSASIQSKANLRAIQTATVSAKAQLRTGLEKQISAKGRIEVSRTKTVSAKGNIKATFTITLTAKGNIVGLGEQTIQAKGKIVIGGQVIQTVEAKGNIFATTTRTVGVKARIFNPLYASVIDKPIFGTTELPFPDEALIEPVWISGDVTTIGGKTRRDVMARKYRYTLRWNYMSDTNYDALESEINDLVAKNFIYQKWPQSILGVVCWGSLSGRKLTYGVGDSGFYSSVTLTLIEANSRI